MTSEHIAILLYKKLGGELTESERAELQRWRQESPEHNEFFDEIHDEVKLTGIMQEEHPDKLNEVEERIYAKVEKRIDFKVIPFHRSSFFRVAVAACIFGLLLVGGYFILFNKKSDNPPIAKITKGDVKAPALAKARITLPDGKEISVDSLTSYTQGKVTVTKTADGRIVYTGFGDKVVFNTLTNPRGSKVIDIQLADQSHVWLNAGSSITYPVAFTGNERNVTMDGEAYFEVAHDANKPFTVSKDKMKVEVLGTHFDVNTYSDEPVMKVSLLEGSVKVTSGNESKAIRPGEQAQVSTDIKVLTIVNMDDVMAWKNGLFSFNRTDVKTLLREISRWYDVEIIYEGAAPKMEFGGEMERTLNLSQVLNALDKSKVKLKLEGKKIIVK
jgi:transmembrane sensor